MDEDRVQFPDGPLIQMGWHVPRRRLILARSVGGFDSLSVHSTLRKVAGYGLPGRTANACHHRGDEGSNPLPSACLQTGSMVKRKSSLASNQKFRVRFLVGLLPKYAVTLAAGIIPLH